MSQPDASKLFVALASSSALSELIKFWQAERFEAQNHLGNLAVSALVKPELQAHALIQYGKVQGLTDLIDYAERYCKGADNVTGS